MLTPTLKHIAKYHKHLLMCKMRAKDKEDHYLHRVQIIIFQLRDSIEHEQYMSRYSRFNDNYPQM